MATKVRSALGQLGAFARDVIGRPSETRPLGKLAVGAAKVAHILESAATGVRAPLPGPQHHAVARLREPIRASGIQAPGSEASRGMAAVPWSTALDRASEVVGDREQHSKPASPKEMVGSELSFITDNLARLLESGHPMLNTVSQYYFSA
ncbi:coq1 putative hexaprenyl diphosphate synthase, partial [Coemansia spiralis]